MELSWLPASTRALWNTLSREKALSGFVLIGGTALSMRIGHRISEDLDFAFLEQELPRKRLDLFLKSLQNKAITVHPVVDVAAQHDFIDVGLDVDDYQQNYVFKTPQGSVKVSFVAFEGKIRQCFRPTQSEFVRVSDLDEIFRTKVLCICDRNKSRDWIDLYMLMKQHGYSSMDLYAALQDTGTQTQFAQLDLRLRTLQPFASDEGYTHLMKDPPTLDMMREFFTCCLDDIEVQLAARRFS